MKQPGITIGAFVFGIVLASAVAIAITFVRDSDEQVDDVLEPRVLSDLPISLDRTPRPCPTLSREVPPQVSAAAQEVGGVLLSIPDGYNLQPAEASSPPGGSGIATYGSEAFGAPNLELTIYPSVGSYPLFNLDGTRRFASSLDEVTHNQFDDFGLRGVLFDCEPLVETRSVELSGKTVGTAKRIDFLADEARFDQRGFVELTDGRFVEVSLYGTTSERPLRSLEQDFATILDSIANLN